MSDYILVIHGTWNAPEDGQLKWFQLDPKNPQNFCYRLNQALASGPLHDSVWRQCPGTEVAFKWSGDNTHEARKEGAEKLCSLLLAMRQSDAAARIHIIAHSHGGNVVLSAIERYFVRLEEQARYVVDRAERKVHLAHAVAIDRALREICGDGLAKSQDLHDLTDEFILPVLQKETVGHRLIKALNRGLKKLSLRERSWPDLDQQRLYNKTLYQQRHYKEFFAAWSRSPQSHRLGRLVFMGTPFYYKRWLPVARLGRPVTLFINFLVYLCLIYLLMSGAIFLVGLGDFEGFNPPRWRAGDLGFVVGAAAFLTIVFLKVSDQGYRDVNMYYTTAPANQLEWTLDKNVQKAPPLDALVLSAGLLDEALMGLSTEPLVYGFLSPELKKRLNPPFFPSGPPKRSGEDPIVAIAKRSVWGVIHFVLAPVKIFSWASRWWTQPRLTELMLDLVSAAGFGLPSYEFSHAAVTPKKELDVPGIFEAGEVVSVTKLFAKTRLVAPSPATPAQFDFLWDQTALEERLKESFTWRRIEPYLDELRARRGRGDNQSELEKFELEVNRLCAMIDVRVREFAGMVELFHSEYYANDKIIEAIARFIETGVRPRSIP
jgi:hypothetical protein